jgi:glycosyltransferase involved in cell wall biosynthesis
MNLTDAEQNILEKAVAILPAYNEVANIASVIDEFSTLFPSLPVVVVNDASTDGTSAAARDAGAIVLDLPCNLGVGGAVQAGLQYAYAAGFEYAIRCDADGQHPIAGIQALVRAMVSEEVDMVIGARAQGENTTKTTVARRAGILYLAFFLSRICKHKVTDPTSGFMLINRLLMRFFSHLYPFEYPEPEALALVRRQGYSFCEAPVQFEARRNGTSSIGATGALYYALKVTLALIVDRARPVDRRYDRQALKEELS